MAGGKKLTKEDEILLQNFSRNVSRKSSALFYANALIVSAMPLCKELKVFDLIFSLKDTLSIEASLMIEDDQI